MSSRNTVRATVAAIALLALSACGWGRRGEITGTIEAKQVPDPTQRELQQLGVTGYSTIKVSWYGTPKDHTITTTYEFQRRKGAIQPLAKLVVTLDERSGLMQGAQLWHQIGDSMRYNVESVVRTSATDSKMWLERQTDNGIHPVLESQDFPSLELVKGLYFQKLREIDHQLRKVAPVRA